MKIRFGFLTLTALVVCKAHAYDLMSKIFHNSRGMNLNPDSADKDCVEKCHVLSDVLKEVAELKEKVNLSSLTVSQTIDQMSQTMSQLSQTVGQLSQTVDQPRQGDDQQNNRKGVCGNGWIEYGDSCYRFSLREELLSWPDALLACREKGGYLAEISDQQENSFIETQAQFLGSIASTSFEASNNDCRDSFLTGKNRIPDSALTASGSWRPGLSPDCGRLDKQAGGGKDGSWLGASRTDVTQWIQADLGRQVKVTSVVTQGRQDYDQWVKTFVVYYSSDCSHWSTVTEANGSEKIFTGNTGRNTKKTNTFPKPVTARCIRINPRTWNSYASMRFDVLGCALGPADSVHIPELSLWLGGTDILQEHNFLWATSGTRITYDTFNDWHPRQPDNARDSEHCLMMDQHSGWHDASCSELKRYVCEKDKK